MALVGRARTRLDLSNLAGAAADAALVPSGFVRNAEFSETTQSRENRIYDLTIRGEFLSVAPAYQGLTVNGAPDPRVKVTNTGRIAADNVTPLWLQQKFTRQRAPSRSRSRRGPKRSSSTPRRSVARRVSTRSTACARVKRHRPARACNDPVTTSRRRCSRSAAVSSSAKDSATATCCGRTCPSRRARIGRDRRTAISRACRCRMSKRRTTRISSRSREG